MYSLTSMAVASLSLPGGQDKNISSIVPHFSAFALIFPQIFFLILVFRVGGSPTREGPGYATAHFLRDEECVHCLFLFPLVSGKMELSHTKLGLFLCSLDNLLQQNIIVFFFGNQISKWRSFEKKGYFWPTFHIFLSPSKVTKIPSAHISVTYIHAFCSLIDFFLP